MSAAVVPLLLAAAMTTGAGSASAAPRRAPSVSRIAPARGATFGGTRVTIVGSNFRQVKAVRFGTAPGRKIRVLSSRKLRVIAPRHAAGSVAVRVVTRSGGSRVTTRSHFTYMPPPAVGRVLPGSGPATGGTSVTVTGRNFTAVRSVVFGATRGTALRVLSPRKLRVVAPAHAVGTVDIRVITAYGRSVRRSADRFSFAAAPKPVWGAAQPIDPNPLVDVSCASSSFCVAVDNGSDAALYDGTSWNVQPVAPGIQLTSVSCVTSSYCLASTTAGLGYRYDGTAWTSVPIAATDELSNAACPTTSICAVADDTTGTVLVALDGTTFSDVSTFPGQQGPIVSLSCEPSYCFAVDGSGDLATLILSNVGSGNAWAPAYPISQPGFVPASLSCPRGQGAGGCLVGGTNGTVMTWSDAAGNWEAKTFTGDTNPIDSVSCTGTGFCMVADSNGQIATLANGVWSELTTVGLSGQNWSGVSCSSATFCVAADDQGTAAVYTT